MISHPTTSYWQRHPQPTFEPLAGDHETDILVIGAGLAGLSAGYWLKHFGGADVNVTLIDSNTIASGASGRNGGLVLSGIAEHFSLLVDSIGFDDALMLWKFTEGCRDAIRALIQEHDIDCDAQYQGGYRLSTLPNEIKEVRRTVEFLVKGGINIEELDPLTIERDLGYEHFTGGYHLPGDFRVHSGKFIANFARIVSERQVSIHTETALQELRFEDDGTVIAVTSRGDIRAVRVILACNAYLGKAVPSLRSLVQPKRGQIAAFAPCQDIDLRGSFYAEYGYIYWQQAADGRLLCGGFRHHAFEEEQGYEEVTTDTIQGAIERFCRKHIPGLGETPLEYGWAGTLGFTVDGVPLVGPMPGNPSLQFLAGFNGHGYSLAFTSAQALAKALINGGQLRLPKYFLTTAAHRSKLFDY